MSHHLPSPWVILGLPLSCSEARGMAARTSWVALPSDFLLGLANRKLLLGMRWWVWLRPEYSWLS